MSCPSCGHENPAGARLCNDCGARLAAPATAPEPRVELARAGLLASEPAPDRTAIESALESVEALATELGADPYRRMAELERARLVETAPP